MGEWFQSVDTKPLFLAKESTREWNWQEKTREQHLICWQAYPSDNKNIVTKRPKRHHTPSLGVFDPCFNALYIVALRSHCEYSPRCGQDVVQRHRQRLFDVLIGVTKQNDDAHAHERSGARILQNPLNAKLPR
jgi:hypothetical protein